MRGVLYNLLRWINSAQQEKTGLRKRAQLQYQATNAFQKHDWKRPAFLRSALGGIISLQSAQQEFNAGLNIANHKNFVKFCAE